MRTLLVAGIGVALLVSAAQGAFIVETRAGGKAVGNASFGGADPNWNGNWKDTTTQSSAVGMTANIGHRYASQSKDDAWVQYSYTPGVDADNTVLSAGTSLGTHKLEAPLNLVEEPQVATGQVGGVTGWYNVYVTWCSTTNVSTAGMEITVTGDGPPIVLNPVVQNSNTSIGGAATNKWLRVGTVHLTAGQTYSVKWDSNAVAWTQIRSGGVMWELVPEPATALLLGLGGLFLRRRRV